MPSKAQGSPTTKDNLVPNVHSAKAGVPSTCNIHSAKAEKPSVYSIVKACPTEQLKSEHVIDC